MDTSDRSESITLQPSAPPLAYALALRITPELQAELIQAKLNGDDATVTFGKGGYNNVIKVRGKEFKFKSVAEDSPCDAYYREEDTLIEAGGVKRKLQVQRQLNSEERDRVRARCEQSEAQQKSRKSHSLNHDQSLQLGQNPGANKSVKTTRVLGQSNLGRQPPSAGDRSKAANMLALSRAKRPPAPADIQRSSTPATKAAAPKPAADAQLKSLERAKRAADVAEAAGKSAVKAMLLVLLEERPLTIQAIEKHLEKSTKSKSLHRKILEKMLKEMCHLKSPGKYHLKPEAQEEARAVIKELEPVPGRGKQPKNAIRAESKEGTVERAGDTRNGTTAQARNGLYSQGPGPNSSRAAKIAKGAAGRKEPVSSPSDGNNTPPTRGRALATTPPENQTPPSPLSGGPSFGRSAQRAAGAPPGHERNRVHGAERTRVDARTIPGTERAQSARGGHEPSASGKDNASLGGTKRRRVVMEEEDEEEEGEEKEAAKELMAEETAAAEEEEFFHPYERESVTSHVRLKGPIRDKKQYDEYSEEYQEKYPVYLRLYKELDDTRGTFVQLLERHRQAESRHEEDEAGKQIKTLNGKIRKRYERMNVVFLHLHEQLTNIKLQVKIFVEARSNS
ncbi:hypothetical protein CYMTET_41930 [Cymbomonas tetramitiformis]|uniref:OCEL domain-containing protein n=1 Tax=Cymbomonas tetramitiformis TaxID=36881 RepID=A0AAE0C676_9CHLO|nr:hypothetical protein CYMTET_41930 [Cymbomonas tetramitiformis]